MKFSMYKLPVLYKSYCSGINFILTGGSDFHGRYGNSPDILGVEAPEEYIGYFC
jgi:hypothetical protein